MATRFLRHPAVTVSLILGALETLPAVYYGRSLAALQPAGAAFSFVLSFAGTSATYLLLLLLSSRFGWARWVSTWAIAVVSVLLQGVHWGIYREFASLPTVSIADFARQNWRYTGTLFLDRLDAPNLVSLTALTLALALSLRRGLQPLLHTGRITWIGLGCAALCCHALARAPFMSLSQHAAWLALHSARGPGVINASWAPDRARPTRRPARNPINVIVFRLEEIAAAATTLDRPELPTTPFLKELIERQPHRAFLASRHFANATATDVSVLGIFTGLSPAAPLEAQRSVPIVWDYFDAAGYTTSLFLPDHLQWGNFEQRFQARPGEMHLHEVVDANNAGQPLVYDHSITDAAVTAAALAYQRGRAWAEPFLQIISLRLPHATGEGARVNRLRSTPWENEPPRLHDYFDAIRHDDLLMREYVAAVPEPVRQRTALVFVSDHGTNLIARTEGSGALNRLDNYHTETTRVPWLIILPPESEPGLNAAAREQLRANFAQHTTSNIDVVPTLLGLTGIEPVDVGVPHSEWLLGRDLTRPIEPTPVVVQLNSGPLRRWDTEHFALVLGDGAFHFLFGMGGEQLFDMRHDPLEQTNLLAERAAPAGAAARRALAQARVMVADVPELRRIQQRYARDSNPTSGEGAAAASGTGASMYALSRFTRHACLTSTPPGACPNGFITWGPYVEGARGSQLRLRYDVEVRREGLEVWLDISAGAGREELARTQAYPLHPGGNRRLELGVQLARDMSGIEGRLHVQDAHQTGVATIVVSAASLTIAAASAP